MRHPIVLPARHHITKLIATHLHKTNLHGGQQALLCLMRRQYWPLGGRTLVRKVIHQCVTCYRARPHIKYPIMGQLPSVRVIPARPFLKSGVDFCGPISIKQSITRNAAITKAYIAVFICMVTKAVHLELVSSLSTESFVAALKRFMSRRGKCQDIYSDNGTNFVGAQSLLSEYHKILMEKKEQDAIAQQIYPDMIQWHFIPPHAPHFGGLWEAGVKNVKHHLQRIMGNKNLLFKELYTLLTEIEACLNSRLITAMSEDPSDLSALTPAHFLIGDTLVLPVEPEIKHNHVNYLKLWELVQTMFRHFWKRWSTEYLSQLNSLKKWTQNQSELQIGDLVLVNDDNLPPLMWKLARVLELHPGADGISRVATVRTTSGTLKRPIVKLCSLPMNKIDDC